MKWIIDLGVIFFVGNEALTQLPNNEVVGWAIGLLGVFYFLSMITEIYEGFKS